MPICGKLEISRRKLRLGYTYLTFVHFHETAPACPYCGNHITVKHILAECTFYARLRRMLQFSESYEDINSHGQNPEIHQRHQLHPLNILLTMARKFGM